MSERRVVHFGGNGHAACRLDAARAALSARPGGWTLADVPYPGFEGRPGAPDRDAFFDAVSGYLDNIGPVAGGYASGIGALIALGVRARGGLAGVPLVFQGPVLWGLERRWFPRVLRRVAPARRLLQVLLTRPGVQDRFVRRHFRRDPGAALRARFFDGYARCPAFGDFFGWFTPESLRDLERRFAAAPGGPGLDGVTVWLGGHDHVVGPAEVEATSRALGVRWPLVVFPDWGHYPMIDAPEEWAAALCDALALA